jgi:hypothetical protein
VTGSSGGAARRVLAAAGLAVLLAVGVVGCGGGGDASGATVAVYVAKPFCAGAKAELASHGATVGSFKVAVDCLASDENAAGGLDLAANGANARGTTEDSSAVAMLEEPGPGNKFALPILESAGIPLVTSPSGQAGMKKVIEAVEGAGSGNVRESVRGALEPS